jgi:hypothetical protein
LEEAALSRLGRDIRRRLRVEQGVGDDVLITPVSADFEDDLGDQR